MYASVLPKQTMSILFASWPEQGWSSVVALSAPLTAFDYQVGERGLTLPSWLPCGLVSLVSVVQYPALWMFISVL